MKKNYMPRLLSPRLLSLALALLVAASCTRRTEDPTTEDARQEMGISQVTSKANRNGVLNQTEVAEGELAAAEAAKAASSAQLYAANATSPIAEGFENASKTSYTQANVTLGSGSWFFYDALIGTTSGSDRFTGTRSARLRNYGEIGNNAPFSGVSTVTLQAAKYGTDGNSTLELWVSTDGSNYSKVGSTVTVSSTNLTTYTFTVNLAGNVYLDIYKADGSANRLSIDNVTVNPFGGTTGGGTGGGTVGGSATRDNNLTMGNPSNATNSVSNTNNYLSVKDQFVISYNSSKGIPNWVSWHLSTAWIGSTGRTDAFRADATLPSTFFRPNETSYSGSGFDRGHMCPSADRTGSTTDNQNTFYMSNMIPQAPNNNQITWANLENYSRTLASAGNELYIISGPMGTGGSGSNGGTTSILPSGVSVPAFTWKVIVVLPIGTGDASRVTSSTRVIAVKMPNRQGIQSQPWGFYRVSVDQLESELGYDLLNAVPTAVQSTIESRVDNGPQS